MTGNLAASHPMSGFDWIATLNGNVQSALLARADEKTFHHGEMIQEGGERAAHVYQVVEGRVRQSILDENGNEILLHIYESGDVFGDTLGLGDLSYPLWLSTSGSATLRRWSVSVFARLRAEYADVEAAVAAQTAKRFRMAIAILTELATLDANGRVAGRLCHLAASVQSPRPLNLSQEDLAMMANVSRQTVNKVLASLAEKGIVTGGYGNILVNDLGALKGYRNARRRRF